MKRFLFTIKRTNPSKVIGIFKDYKKHIYTYTTTLLTVTAPIQLYSNEEEESCFCLTQVVQLFGYISTKQNTIQKPKTSFMFNAQFVKNKRRLKTD
jgi:hypothetical protein